MAEVADRLLTVDEISDLIWEREGIRVKPESLTHYASQSRGKRSEGRRLDKYDMPIPRPRDAEEWVRFVGEGRMGPRTVQRPRWRESVIVRWREAGRRPPPARRRIPAGHEHGGRYAPPGEGEILRPRRGKRLAERKTAA